MDIENLIQKNFKEIRRQKGLTQEGIAKSLGVTKSLINQWESGKANISFERILQFSNLYGIDIGQLNEIKGEDGRTYYKVPVLGEVACGLPIFAQDNIVDYKLLPVKKREEGQFFYLKAKGDSMIDVGIEDGDYILMKTENTLKKGEIGAFLFKDNSEVNLKIYKPQKDKVILESANKNYQGIVIESKDLNNLQIFAKFIEVEK